VPATSYNLTEKAEKVAPGGLLIVYDRRQFDPSGSLCLEIAGTTATLRRR